MPHFRTGNTQIDGADYRGWFVGHFVKGDAMRRTGDVEIAWAVHPKGTTNGKFVANRTATTVSILIRGQFKILFRTDLEADDVLLEREGDYAMWPPLVEHDWLAEEDSVVLTVRWPSKPNDQE
ncbi:MAG: signal peptidase I [Phycisphaerae bacterium]|nr:signal peptidase I [Phycisphaerae bacterium]